MQHRCIPKSAPVSEPKASAQPAQTVAQTAQPTDLRIISKKWDHLNSVGKREAFEAVIQERNWILEKPFHDYMGFVAADPVNAAQQRTRKFLQDTIDRFREVDFGADKGAMVSNILHQDSLTAVEFMSLTNTRKFVRITMHDKRDKVKVELCINEGILTKLYDTEYVEITQLNNNVTWDRIKMFLNGVKGA